MKALDSLKMDIDNYNEVLVSKMEKIYENAGELYLNWGLLYVDDIFSRIKHMNEDIIQIEKETAVLRKMEQYHKLLKKEQKQEQDNANNDFIKWVSDDFEKETLL